MLVMPPRSELRVCPIETSRLVLAPIDGRDGSELWEAVESSRAHLEPWLPWVPFVADPDASTRYAEASVVDWEQGRACRFAIRERTSRRFVGVVGLESLAHIHESGDLGYWLRLDATGQGLMTEAAHTIVNWFFQRMKAHRLRVAAATDNHPSLQVIARLGFRFEGIARQAERCGHRWLDHAQFALLESDLA